MISHLAFAEDVLPEGVLRDAVELLARLVEAAGALVVFVGAVVAFVRWARAALDRHRVHEFTRVRLSFGRYLVLGLEFQLAGDVLKTAVTPGLEEIGELAAIAAIRTLLNYFLMREIAHERAEVDAGRDG